MNSLRLTILCLYLVTTVSPSATCSKMVKLLAGMASTISGYRALEVLTGRTLSRHQAAVDEVGSYPARQ